jgi:outer membrane protein OmpA-like peptidoglycan-associated protein
MSPMAPWTLFLGAGWNVDTQERPPVEKLKTVEKTIEGRPPIRGHIKGLVHEKDKTDEIKNAIVTWENHPELEALYTGDDGRFVTQELPEGKYAFTIKADGYKDGTCDATLLKGGADAQADCPLEALPRIGTIVGHVRDAETMAAVPNATVKITDAQGKPLQVSADSNGAFRFEGVSPGTAQMQVDADDYLTFVMPTDVKVRQEVNADPVIRHRPKQGLVTVGKTEITIKQQIQFALDQAVILPESTPLLNEIADVLIHNPRIKRIEIQGHTDNSGTPDHNQTLSEQRAESVRSWLTSHGVTPDRLVSKGYGQSKPLVPNVTAAMKAKNRRVQFIITDQDAETPPAGGAAGGAGGVKPKPAPPPF